MPTVLRQDGYEVVIRTDDHLPPHVHVFKGGAEGRIGIGHDDLAPWLMGNWGMGAREMKGALRLVEAHQARLLVAWREIHGD